jgi:predicted permease
MLSSVRVAIRSLARRPAIAAVAIISLAVGIGINSAVFSLVDATFLRPPAVANPESIVQISGSFKDSGYASIDFSDARDIAAQSTAFSDVTLSMGRGGLWRNGDETVLLLLDAVGNNYFEMLGVKPLLGELPGANHNYAADPEPPLAITHWLWRERMGGRADIIGQRIEFRDHIWRIAAVLPPAFRGLNPLGQRHLWIPLGSWERYFRADLERGNGQFQVVARLKPGVSLEQAQAQLNPLAARIEELDSRVPKGRRLVATSVGREMKSRLRPGILVMAVVGLVLLVACANVAAVLLAHAEARRREIGLRLSLGAGRLALIRQFLTESAVLAVAGAALGLLLAAWLLSLVPVLAPPSPVPMNLDFRIDLRVLLFTAMSVLVTLLAFGLAPLGYALRVSVLEAISGSRTTGRSPQSVLRFALVTAQVTLSVVLVGGAVTLSRSLSAAAEVYPGYDTSRPLALVWANTAYRTGGPPEVLSFSEAARRMSAVAGVREVTFARHLPLVGSGAGASISITPEGATPDAPPPRVYFNLVGPRFFEVVGARLAAGRTFTAADHGAASAPVAMLNAEAARRFWPGQDPVGKILRTGQGSFQVVGIAADGRIAGLHEQPAPALYLPASRMRWGETILIAQTNVDPSAIVKELAKAAEQGGDLRVYQSSTLRSLVQAAMYGDWIPTVLGGLLAVVGLLLAAGGLYGAVSYATERRLSEFGVRMALGARASQVAALVVRQAVLLCAAGVPIGVLLFIATYRYLGETLLRGRPMDIAALATGAAIAVAVVLAGAVLPAVRAARLDPIAVLRRD